MIRMNRTAQGRNGGGGMRVRSTTADAPSSSTVSVRAMHSGQPRAVGAARARHLRLPVWSVVALAVVGGLGIGRFLTAGGDGGTPATGAGAAGLEAVQAPDDRVGALEAAVDARPEDATAWRLLGSAYVQQAIEVGDPAYYDLAERAFAEATELAPDDPTVLVGRGALQLSRHVFDEAEQLGQRAVAALPGNADALGVLVDAQIELGRYDAAASTLQAMLDARPGLPALARTSYLRQLNGDLDGAIEAMRRAEVAGSPSPFDEATVTALLGDLQRIDGDPAAALSSYERALATSPGLVAGELGRARVLGARSELAAAVAVVEEVVERFPTPSALFLLADLQHALGDRAAEEQTVDLVRATSRLQQEAGQIVDIELAVFEADVADDLASARRYARAAYDARPDNVFAADALAWALFRDGDAAGAVPFAEQAVRLGTADPVLQYHAAEVFAAVGDDVRAAEHLRQALRSGPAFSARHADAVSALAEALDVPVPPTAS